MAQYKFLFDEPYEFDDDDSQDESHDVGWQKSERSFFADSDEAALKTVREIVANSKKTLCDQDVTIKPISLVKIINAW